MSRSSSPRSSDDRDRGPHHHALTSWAWTCGSPRSTTLRPSGRSTTSRSPPPRSRSISCPARSRTSSRGRTPAPAPTPCSWPRSTALVAGFGSLVPVARPTGVLHDRRGLDLRRTETTEGIGHRQGAARRARSPSPPRTASTPAWLASSAATRPRSRCTPSCGFEIVGTEREVGRKFNRWLDVVLMERMLTLMSPTDTFPRQSARTQRFTLGAPRNVSVSRPTGSVVTFLRSAGPEDPVTALWVARPRHGGTERCVADPRVLLSGDEDDLPPEERARRERARESAAGITAYATDAATAWPWRRSPDASSSPICGPARPASWTCPDRWSTRVLDPTGTRVAWAHDRALWVADLDDPQSARLLVGEDDPEGAVGRGRVRRRRGDRPRPRVLVVTRRRRAARRPRRRHPGRSLVDRRPGPSRHRADARSRTRPPGTANADVSAWLVPLEGRPHRGCLGPTRRGPTSPRRAWDATALCSRS